MTITATFENDDRGRFVTPPILDPSSEHFLDDAESALKKYGIFCLPASDEQQRNLQSFSASAHRVLTDKALQAQYAANDNEPHGFKPRQTAKNLGGVGLDRLLLLDKPSTPFSNDSEALAPKNAELLEKVHQQLDALINRLTRSTDVLENSLTVTTVNRYEDLDDEVLSQLDRENELIVTRNNDAVIRFLKHTDASLLSYLANNSTEGGFKGLQLKLKGPQDTKPHYYDIRCPDHHVCVFAGLALHRLNSRVKSLPHRVIIRPDAAKARETIGFFIVPGRNDRAGDSELREETSDIQTTHMKKVAETRQRINFSSWCASFCRKIDSTQADTDTAAVAAAQRSV